MKLLYYICYIVYYTAKSAGITNFIDFLFSYVVEYTYISREKSTLEYFLIPVLVGPLLILVLPESIKSKKRSLGVLSAGHIFLFMCAALVLGFMYPFFRYTIPFMEYLWSNHYTINTHFIVKILLTLNFLAALLIISFSSHRTLVYHGIGFIEMSYFFISPILNLDFAPYPYREYLTMGGLLYTEGIVLGPIFLYLFKIRNKL